jgi:TolB-like protein/class 3 adenylate cyclase/Flp pilus assembly protein TadD
VSQRQLAAIMFTDIVGYTDLMGKDQQKALTVLTKNRDLQKPLIEQYSGRLIKEMGDGMMASFASVSEAIQCAHDIQKKAWSDDDLNLRVGIHLGEVVFEGEDVFGDGVNIASRLETLADPGGIYISESVHKSIRGMDITSKYLGEFQLKNVDYPVKTYAIQGEGLPIPDIKEEQQVKLSLWEDINRRGVFRAAITYIGLGFAIFLVLSQYKNWIEVGISSEMAATIELIIKIILIAGFPLSMFLAWSYERSPDGFVRTSSQASFQNPYTPSQKKPFTNRVIIVVLALIIVFMYFSPQTGSKGAIEIDESREKTIAVLPFKNLSDDPETQYFVDGTMDVILTNLSRISDLQVTSRTSVEQYRERQVPVRQIAQELNVNYLLEASVQRVDNRMRIVVQLIDAEEDKHIWAENYNEEWTDILQLESDLSLQIAEQLHARIGNPEIKEIRTAHQTNPLAHDFVLKGNNFWIGNIGTNKQDLDYARQMYEQALQVDPNYALAWYNLGNVERAYYHFYHNRTSEQKEKAKIAFERAMELKPDLYESQKGMAQYYYSCEGDYETSVNILKELLKKYPTSADIKSWLAYNYRRMNDLENTGNFFEESVTLEPTTWSHWYGYGQYLRRAGEYKKSEEAFKRAIILNPASNGTHFQLAALYRSVGEVDKAWEILNRSRFAENYTVLANYHLYTRNFREALRNLKKDQEEVLSFQSLYRPTTLSKAFVYHMMGSDSARAFFEKSIDPIQKKLEEVPEDGRVLLALGLAYAGVGETQKALEYGEKAVSIIDISKDALQGSTFENQLMQIYIVAGEYDKAVNMVQKLVDHNKILTIYNLRQDPLYDPIREMPKFQAILENPDYQFEYEGT